MEGMAEYSRRLQIQRLTHSSRPKTAPPSLGTYYQPPGLKVVAKGDIVFIPAKADNAGNWLTRPTRSASTSHLPYEHPAIVKEVHGKTVILCACTSLDGKTLAEKYPSPHLTFERSRYRFIAHQDNTGEYNHPDNLPELKLDPACSTKQGMTKPCYVNIGDVAECEKWCLRPLRGQGQRMLGLAITQESLGLLDPKAKPATQSQQSRR